MKLKTQGISDCSQPLQKHVETALELILGNRGYKIRITEPDSGDYKPIQEYNAKAIPERYLRFYLK